MSELKTYDVIMTPSDDGHWVLKSEADAEIRRLKRALYKACANWANLEVFERTVGIDDPNVEANRWALMRTSASRKQNNTRRLENDNRFLCSLGDIDLVRGIP